MTTDYKALVDALPDLNAGNEDPRKRKKPADLVDSLPDISKPPSVGEDVARAVPWSIPKALVGLLGVPRDVYDMTTAGREKLYSYLPDWMQGNAKSIDDAVRNLQPVNMLARNSAGSQDLRRGAESVTGPWYDPQTRVGKLADTGVQTAATMGRNWLTTPGKAAVLTSAITGGTEGAGALTDDNPWARMLGGIVAGGIPAAHNALRSNKGAVVRDTIGDVTPAQERAAIDLQRRAQTEGLPLMGTEALDRGHNLASYILSSHGGGQTMTDFITRRPGQVEAAVRKGLIQPTGNVDTPLDNAARAQRAATGVIDDAENARSAAVAPFYKAARQDVISPEALQAASNVIADQRAFFPLPGQQSAMNRFAALIDTAPGMNAAKADAIYKGARNEADLPAIGATPEQKQAAAALGPVTAALKSATEESPNLVAGRQRYQHITRNQVEPLTSGPMGRIAGKGFDPAQVPAVERVTGAVSNADQIRAPEIRTLYTQLNKQDAQAFPGIAKTWIENELNTALADLRGGPNPTAGSKVRQALYGTPQQRENFDEVMRGVATAGGKDPEAVVQGTRNLMELLERTGRTPGMGSPTSTRADINRQMSRNLFTDAAEMVSTSPASPFTRRLREWQATSNAAELARVLTAPNSVELLVKMAKLRPNGLTMRYYVASLLGLDAATAAAVEPATGHP